MGLCLGRGFIFRILGFNVCVGSLGFHVLVWVWVLGFGFCQADVVNGEVIERGDRRVSLTFRKVGVEVQNWCASRLGVLAKTYSLFLRVTGSTWPMLLLLPRSMRQLAKVGRRVVGFG